MFDAAPFIRKPNRYILARFIVLFSLLITASSPALSTQILKIYTWAEYMDPQIIAQFEQEFDTEVELSYFESDQSRDEQMAVVAGRGYDLLLLNSIRVKRYGNRKWIEPLDKTLIPNIQYIDPQWIHAFEGVDEYAVPYFWGTMGIAYRKDLVPAGFDSWMDLLNPDERLRNKITMTSDSRELTAIALAATGHSVNSGKSSHLKDAREVLLEQRPFIKQYTYPSLSEDSSLLDGTVWAASMYSGDTLMLQEQDENIAYTLPKEGGLLWADYFTVAQASTNKILAHQFLNFINQPAIAARLAEWVFYATPNLAAANLMSNDYTNNTVINPNSEQLKNSEFIQPLSPRTQKKVNSIGADLLRGYR